jgi:hypothetical protein
MPSAAEVQAWTPEQVSAHVAGLGGALAQWEGVFLANAVCGEMFLELTIEDMADDLGTWRDAQRLVANLCIDLCRYISRYYKRAAPQSDPKEHC